MSSSWRDSPLPLVVGPIEEATEPTSGDEPADPEDMESGARPVRRSKSNPAEKMAGVPLMREEAGGAADAEAGAGNSADASCEPFEMAAGRAGNRAAAEGA